MCSLANAMVTRYKGWQPCVNLFCLVSNLFVGQHTYWPELVLTGLLMVNSLMI